MLAAPAASREAKNTRVRHHRSADTCRHSLRDGVTAYSGLSPETGLCCLRRLPITACRAREGPRSPIDRLDPSIGGPGPHAFAVREECFRPRVKRAEHPHVHRLPLPTSVTIAIRPSCGGGMRADNHVFPKNGRGIFYAKGVDICSDYTK